MSVTMKTMKERKKDSWFVMKSDNLCFIGAEHKGLVGQPSTHQEVSGKTGLRQGEKTTEIKIWKLQ